MVVLFFEVVLINTLILIMDQTTMCNVIGVTDKDKQNNQPTLQFPPPFSAFKLIVLVL